MASSPPPQGRWESPSRACEGRRALQVAVLPQFIPDGASHFAMGLLLTTVHILIGLMWSAVLIAFARVLHGWLRKPQARRVLDRITGTVIAAFGVRLALAD
ncbi:LysE family transporter [Streptomyces sp. AcE210]|uniref:LysE family translocator n=1 Tax=Streptomyces sp. AcE210 TaxID=2292703 RepID=UPI0032046F66